MPSRPSLSVCFVDIQVELHRVAKTLIEVRQWLQLRGCRNQVFRCGRCGALAQLRIEFDEEDPQLRERFQAHFAPERAADGSDRHLNEANPSPTSADVDVTYRRVSRPPVQDPKV